MKDMEIPEGLSPLGKRAAEIILDTADRVQGSPADSGGCRTFYTPQQWWDRGELYGHSAELVVVHDGGDIAKFFNYMYESHHAMREMRNALQAIGVHAEPCTGWYTAIYKNKETA